MYMLQNMFNRKQIFHKIAMDNNNNKINTKLREAASGRNEHLVSGGAFRMSEHAHKSSAIHFCLT